MLDKQKRKRDRKLAFIRREIADGKRAWCDDLNQMLCWIYGNGRKKPPFSVRGYMPDR